MRKFIKSISIIMALAFCFTVLPGMEQKPANLVLKTGSSQAIVNGQLTIISEEDPMIIPQIIDDRAYLPVDFIETNLGIEIDVNNSNSITIEGVEYSPLRSLAEN
ncbi:MAG: copper amine oxidase N-terminal domain-containing protein, partial [Clostridiales bacterium]|nr:copper amine oxidase N-terminal domain-containing protein [Clostridiales bacterium]